MYRDKILAWIGAAVLLIAGTVAAYYHAWLYMAGLFWIMGYCLGIALRGRNSWIK